MNRIEEQASAAFTAWEKRTRGWDCHPHPVPLEPAFARFKFQAAIVADDGIRRTFVSDFWRSLWRRPPATSGPDEEEESPQPPYARGALIELPLYLPADFEPDSHQWPGFLRAIRAAHEPIGLEWIGTGREVKLQLCVSGGDLWLVRQQLRAHFPELVTTAVSGGLEAAWNEAGEHAGILELGLEREGMLPILTPEGESHASLVAILGDLDEDETAVVQVLCEPATAGWADELVRAVEYANGRPRWINRKELVEGAETKRGQGVYATLVRIAAATGSPERTWDILRTLAFHFLGYADPRGNALVPLVNDTYPDEAHREDLLRRVSRRPGFLAGLDELSALTRLPGPSVKHPRFKRQLRRTNTAPSNRASSGLLLGINEHAGEEQKVFLSTEERTRHVHVIGASGTGKTTLLYNMIRQDLEKGEGFAVLDPHGDLVESILGIIPEKRIKDVVLLDPGEEEWSVPFNILSAHSDLEKNLLASDLVSVFQRLSTSWGDQMGVVLANAIRVFLESERGGTLADLRRFLVEPKFRFAFLDTVRDPELVYYWKTAFAQLSGTKSIGPVLTRLETFLGPKPIRYMVAQRENRVDFAQIMDQGKILLAKLSQGTMGAENSHLMGSLLLSKFQQVAMGRQGQRKENRRPFWIYMDEFQNFVSRSTAEILTDARKYGVGLALAHHELRQLQKDSDVYGAVLANPFTRVCFRIGDADARALAGGYAHFTAADLQNLNRGQAIARLERSDHDFNLDVLPPELPEEDDAQARRQAVRLAARNTYGVSRAELDKFFAVDVRVAEEPAAPSPPPARPAPMAKQADLPVPPVETTPSRPVEPTVKQAEPPIPVPPRVEPPAKPAEVPTLPPLPPPVAAPMLPAVPILIPPERVIPKPVPTPGRGSLVHKELQARIKGEAEALGFRAVVEHTVQRGYIDVTLERSGRKIAVEICAESTPVEELKNARKCLRSGYREVVVLAFEAEKLDELQKVMKRSLKDEYEQVAFFLPENFLTWLSRQKDKGPKSKVKKRHGWEVQLKGPDLSPEEYRKAEAKCHEAVAQAIREQRAKETIS